ncbi:MAG: hypothetical protein K2X49_24515, partial [Acetobacteraceae bacterium]|nr:hypothetical protein [Acetobacteraceae bacterium]
PKQHPRCRPSAPDGTVENAVTVDEPPLPVEPGDPEASTAAACLIEPGRTPPNFAAAWLRDRPSTWTAPTTRSRKSKE